MEQLAIQGGAKVRTEPWPVRTPFGEEEIKLVTEAIRSQNLFAWDGHFVRDFENEFAALYGVKHAVASTSGTASIHLAVGALDPDPGDEIITAPITDLGSVVPILLQNCIPVFADVDDTYNMDPADVEAKITPRTRAIIAVHLFGSACRIDRLREIAQEHSLMLIEDCSQAHATRYKGRYLGTWGDVGCFSLQQSKHMTTGDGGMTITNDEALYRRMWLFSDKGFIRKLIGARSYEFLAPCYRMNEETAAVGLPQVKRVRARVEKRMELGNRLTELLRGISGVSPAPVTPGSEHSYWAYPLGVHDWDAATFAEALRAEGIWGKAGYIGRPIFMCAEACVSKKTYGDSRFPYDSPYASREIEYTDQMCPNVYRMLNQMVTVGFDESYEISDIEDMARGIDKVARLLPKR
ncbi:MAG: DegT/DnrJ/EryC1/StrS family aminotransferase [Planctomycetota bacterium]|jgi:dTDP-4-amino-4,6-dideoxygalactose transaminase